MPSRAARSAFSRQWQHPAVALVLLVSAGCDEPRASSALRVEGILHLEEQLDSAVVEGSELPDGVPEARVWRFDEPQPDWKPVGYRRAHLRLPRTERLDDAVRLTLSSRERPGGWRPHGGLYVEVPEWDPDEWSCVVVRLRSSDPVDHLELGVNLRRDKRDAAAWGPFEASVPEVPTIDDGTAHDYVFRLDQMGENRPQDVWSELGVYVGADDAASVDILRVSLVPREADFSEQAVGVRISELGGEHHRAIYTHGSTRLSYDVEIPAAARLDLGLGVLRDDPPVVFRVTAAVGDERPSVLLEESHADFGRWAIRSIDLSEHGGQRVTLSLEVETEPGTVALWASPALSSRRPARAGSPPNVILYVIDGGGADYMSLFGYNRSNTPQLERLAASGTLFERAYASASWTKPSTASFMTSVPHSALGGYASDTGRVPEAAATMAELLHAAGYQTGVIVSNPYAASLSGLERGADFMVETGVEPNNSESSRLLHEAFWRWRSEYPGAPYWVHFQSTDVHEPFHPVAPFSGLYVDPQLRRLYEEWDPKLYPGGGWREPAAYTEHGIDQSRYAYAQQGLYDEGMAHNDSRIGELVARLKRRGEWKNTLLIVTADHGYPAACHRLMEPLGPMWGPLFTSHETHVPLLFVWPDHITPRQRVTEPVSLLDLLPTVLDLLDLPIPETAQGRTLAPLLLGEGGWKPGPVILDEFYVDKDSGELHGLIEVVDGSWGASLEIGEGAANEVGGVGARTDEKRPTPLLIYDLRRDPFTLRSVHEERPELVEKYRRFLERQLVRHHELAKTLGQPGQTAIRPEQLEALRALGYVD